MLYLVKIKSCTDPDFNNSLGPYEYEKAVEVEKNLNHDNSNFSYIESLKTHVVKKGKKYLTGNSYATGIGDSYTWSFKKSEARKLDKNLAETFAGATNGKIIVID